MVSPPMLSLTWGAQITITAHSFIRQLELEVHDLNEVIQVEGTGAFSGPYSGNIEEICGSHSLHNMR